jgi:hypothetical protein
MLAMTTEIVMDHTGDKPAFVNLPSSKEAAQTSAERRCKISRSILGQRRSDISHLLHCASQ